MGSNEENRFNGRVLIVYAVVPNQLQANLIRVLFAFVVQRANNRPVSISIP
jgi:hypothetical protein